MCILGLLIHVEKLVDSILATFIYLTLSRCKILLILGNS